MIITGEHIADVAEHSGLLGTPYSKLDCQAFVEVVLQKAGMKIPNYRGSNHMWRELVYDRTPFTDAYDVDNIPVGVLVFVVKDDGGEKKRGYNDNMGNAAHVGIYLGNGRVIHSATGGVQYGTISRFTGWAKIKDVNYGGVQNDDEYESQGSTGDFKQALLQYCQVLRDNLDGLEELIHDLYRNP